MLIIMVRKIISVFIVCMLALSLLSIAVSAADEAESTTAAPDKVNYVVIGDNISTGKDEKIFGLIKGITPYGQLVTQKKAYSLSSFINAGYTSNDILKKCRATPTLALKKALKISIKRWQ